MSTTFWIDINEDDHHTNMSTGNAFRVVSWLEGHEAEGQCPSDLYGKLDPSTLKGEFALKRAEQEDIYNPDPYAGAPIVDFDRNIWQRRVRSVIELVIEAAQDGKVVTYG